MKNIFKILLKVGAIVAVLGVIAFFALRYNTKAHSPEDTVSFTKGDLELEVFYNRPYKKGRKIFGELVPYGQVWRTGANEATTFSTNKDIEIDGSLLEAGKYTLWTIPGPDSWKVIFNSKMYPWGINLDEEAYRDPEYDVLVLEKEVRRLDSGLEQFTIFFEEANDLIFFILAWDDVAVYLPLKTREAP